MTEFLLVNRCLEVQSTAVIVKILQYEAIENTVRKGDVSIDGSPSYMHREILVLFLLATFFLLFFGLLLLGIHLSVRGLLRRDHLVSTSAAWSAFAGR